MAQSAEEADHQVIDENKNANMKFEIITVIVNFGIGSRVLKAAMAHGVTGGTILMGKGTVRNQLLELLGLNDVRKEIVLMVVESRIAERALVELDRQFDFERPHHGIAFSADLAGFFGARAFAPGKSSGSLGGGKSMYKAVFTVVDRGKADSVIDAAVAAGSRGATVINARGSGIHEKKMLFSVPIEPEKDIVMILAEESLVESVVTAIRESLKIDEPGMGILFVVDISRTFGLY